MIKERKTVLNVQGMTCPSCIRHVRQALNEVDGVNDAEVRLAEGQVVVKHEEGAAVDLMVQALLEAGYEASPKAA